MNFQKTLGWLSIFGQLLQMFSKGRESPPSSESQKVEISLRQETSSPVLPQVSGTSELHPSRPSSLEGKDRA